MTEKFTVNKSAINPRARKTKNKPPQLTADQRAHLSQQRKEKNEKIKAAVEKWLTETLETADRLAEEFGRSRRYFLDMFFQGGVHLTRPRAKTNAYNAFKWWKAKELREEGAPLLDVQELDEIYREEYDNLDDNELEDIIEEYEKEKGTERDGKPQLPLNIVKLPTARARAQDVANVATNMARMASYSSLR
ncbi:hypothetical protein V5O48_010090 [Marasmius crinis-equi]|uniref:Uncharacterized protein n=1 Tax=Marasmius crinis-equi TaxID=585013 RepID=A0ABR3F9F5_9AGAR